MAFKATTDKWFLDHLQDLKPKMSLTDMYTEALGFFTGVGLLSQIAKTVKAARSANFMRSIWKPVKEGEFRTAGEMRKLLASKTSPPVKFWQLPKKLPPEIKKTIDTPLEEGSFELVNEAVEKFLGKSRVPPKGAGTQLVKGTTVPARVERIKPLSHLSDEVTEEFLDLPAGRQATTKVAKPAGEMTTKEFLAEQAKRRARGDLGGGVHGDVRFRGENYIERLDKYLEKKNIYIRPIEPPTRPKFKKGNIQDVLSKRLRYDPVGREKRILLDLINELKSEIP